MHGQPPGARFHPRDERPNVCGTNQCRTNRHPQTRDPNAGQEGSSSRSTHLQDSLIRPEMCWFPFVDPPVAGCDQRSTRTANHHLPERRFWSRSLPPLPKPNQGLQKPHSFYTLLILLAFFPYVSQFSRTMFVGYLASYGLIVAFDSHCQVYCVLFSNHSDVVEITNTIKSCIADKLSTSVTCAKRELIARRTR